jgi:hypothetical protein
MREIRGAAIGTYYAKGAHAAGKSSHASPMRGLVYAVKNNRPVPNPPQRISHARHPSPVPMAVDRDNAVEYLEAIVRRHGRRIREYLGTAPSALLVPVPSSSVIAATLETDRFPAYKLARAYERAGLGQCAVLAVNRAAKPAKTTSGRRTADDLLANLEIHAERPTGADLILIDDLVTSGASLAALDKLLGASGKVRAFCVAQTDSTACASAYDPRSYVVRYDPDAPSLEESLTISSP